MHHRRYPAKAVEALGDASSILGTANSLAPAASAFVTGNYQQALQNLVTDVQIETVYTPLVDIQQPFAPSPPSAPSSFLLSLLKPKVTLSVPGQSPVVLAPYGDPGASQFGTVAGVGLGVIGLAALLFLL